MASVRPPAVAGAFYPADPLGLRRTVESLLDDAQEVEAPPPRALLVPHAGYRYSGPVAATAFAHLARTRPGVSRVVLVGPSHFARFEGIALPGVEALATPLGLLPADLRREQRLLEQPGTAVSPAAHAREHSLEVQLPFLQAVLGEPAVTALLCGWVEPDTVARAIAETLDDPGSLLVVSSDLSHYLPQEEARRRDEETARAVERLDPDALDEASACGSTGVRALLLVARARRLSVTRLDLRTSGDTTGDRRRVVGYGAFAAA